jgi:hypothetical protein
MFTEMIYAMCTNISDRSCDGSDLNCFCLDPKHFANCQKNFPSPKLNCLIETFSKPFDAVNLRTELVTAYSDAEFHKIANKLHKNAVCKAARTGECAPLSLRIRHTHPHNTSYKYIDSGVIFWSQKTKKITGQ